MSKQMRFGIGGPRGLRSTTWKVWTNRNDVYLSSRTLASQAKVSLHESGDCQFSETSESFAGKQKSNLQRHMQKWRRRKPYSVSNVTHMFRVIFPFTELRTTSAEKKEARGVIWYPAPALGYGAYVDLWLTPVLCDQPVQSVFMNDLLGVVTLESGRFLGVTAHYMEIDADSNEKLRDLKSRAVSTSCQQSLGLAGGDWRFQMRECIR